MSRIIAPDGTFDYDDLDRAARRVASALLDGQEDLAEARVAFLVPPSFAHLAIARGIWRAGGVAVPLAISHPAAELDYVIRDSEASVVIATRALAERVQSLAVTAAARFVLAEDVLSNDGAIASAGRRVDSFDPAERPDRRALIVYTSGTTARPKGVVTTHGNIAAQIGSLVAAWEWTAQDRTLLVLPLHHVHGIINVVGCATKVGATLEILDHFDADATWARLASGDVSVFTAVPTIYQRLIRAWDSAAPADRERMSAGCRAARVMMSGSAALPVSVLERWRAMTGQTLLERYGMTEIGMALSNPLHGVRRPGTVGAPLPNVEARVVDEGERPVSVGTPGELEIRGPSVFLEYWKKPEETARAFRGGWFRTGDVAVVEDGYYRLLGRTSVDIIKSGGFKVSALEVEEVVREHPAVVDCAVIGRPDADWGERVCVAIETRPGTSISLGELDSWTKSRLAPYKVPKDLCCVSALPRNAMGKVVKAEVSKLFSRESTAPNA